METKDLTPLIKAIERLRTARRILWAIVFLAILACCILASNQEWSWILAPGTVSLIAAGGIAAFAVRHWRLGATMLLILALALAVALLAIGFAIWETVSRELDPDSAKGLLILLVPLGMALGGLVQGLRAARYRAFSDLGNWHDTALQSQRERRVPPKRMSWKPSWRTWTGGASGVAAFGSLLGYLYSVFSAMPTRGTMPFFLTGEPLTLWLAVITTTTAIHLIRLDRRLGAVPASQVIRNNPTAPILYLRSFDDDSLRLQLPYLSGSAGFQDLLVSLRGIRFEEFVTSRLARHGEVIAIGKPGEPLPLLGASRDYFAHSEWQAAIRNWMQLSQRVLMVVGRTEGVGWEFEELRRLGVEDKLILLFPPEPIPARQARWSQFGANAPQTVALGLADLQPAHALAVCLRTGDSPLVFCCERMNLWAYDAVITLAFSGRGSSPLPQRS